MSAEKHQQLVDEGKLNPDGSLPRICPACLRPFGPGEGLPEGESVTVTAAPVAVETATGDAQ